MNTLKIGMTLRERLGDDGARELLDVIKDHADKWRAETVNICCDRFDVRLKNYAEKSAVDEGFARVIDKLAETKIDLSHRLADMRVELLRWSFAFWIGQIVVLAALLRVLIR